LFIYEKADYKNVVVVVAFLLLIMTEATTLFSCHGKYMKI